ncbi:MAG: H-NS histone family protein [Oxalobacteraceae bacterium]|nr:MAG: H-NS histone family protein [Oxalobacteraceae bacterium]
MAKSLSIILNQIDKLQREAASIQRDVVVRIRKEIVKYGLTAEQLFGEVSAVRGRAAQGATKRAGSDRPIKYADGQGNTWGGIGKRPAWLREALDAGKSISDFLVQGGEAAVPAEARAAGKRPGRATVAAAPPKAGASAAVKAGARASSTATRSSRTPRAARQA